MIKWLLTDFGQAGRVNIWLSVMTHRPRCAQSVHRDLEPNIFFHTFHLDIFFVLIFLSVVFILENEKTGFLGLPGLISTSPLGLQCGLASSMDFFISPMFKDQLFSSSK